MYCSNCGNILEDGVVICPVCGKNQTDEEAIRSNITWGVPPQNMETLIEKRTIGLQGEWVNSGKLVDAERSSAPGQSDGSKKSENKQKGKESGDRKKMHKSGKLVIAVFAAALVFAAIGLCVYMYFVPDSYYNVKKRNNVVSKILDSVPEDASGITVDLELKISDGSNCIDEKAALSCSEDATALMGRIGDSNYQTYSTDEIGAYMSNTGDGYRYIEGKPISAKILTSFAGDVLADIDDYQVESDGKRYITATGTLDSAGNIYMLMDDYIALTGRCDDTIEDRLNSVCEEKSRLETGKSANDAAEGEMNDTKSEATAEELESEIQAIDTVYGDCGGCDVKIYMDAESYSLVRLEYMITIDGSDALAQAFDVSGGKSGYSCVVKVEYGDFDEQVDVRIPDDVYEQIKAERMVSAESPLIGYWQTDNAGMYIGYDTTDENEGLVVYLASQDSSIQMFSDTYAMYNRQLYSRTSTGTSITFANDDSECKIEMSDDNNTVLTWNDGTDTENYKFVKTEIDSSLQDVYCGEWYSVTDNECQISTNQDCEYRISYNNGKYSVETGGGSGADYNQVVLYDGINLIFLEINVITDKGVIAAEGISFSPSNIGLVENVFSVNDDDKEGSIECYRADSENVSIYEAIKAYQEYINNLDMQTYSLVYIDDDEIPELCCYDDNVNCEGVLCHYNPKTGKISELPYYNGLYGCQYRERENIIYLTYGEFEDSMDEYYAIADDKSGFVVISKGERYFTYDENYMAENNYTIDGSYVSEEEYEDFKNKYGKFTQMQADYYSLYDAFIAVYPSSQSDATESDQDSRATGALDIEITRHEFKFVGSDVDRIFVNDLVQITSDGSENIKDKINQDLHRQYEERDKGKDNLSSDGATGNWQEESGAEENAAGEYYFYTYKAETPYQDDSFLCVWYTCNWYAGGIHNGWTEGATYNMSTGDILGIRDFIDGTDDEIKQKIVDAYNEQYGLGTTVENAFGEYTDLDDLEFYIDKDYIYVSFGPYSPLAGNGELLITFDR